MTMASRVFDKLPKRDRHRGYFAGDIVYVTRTHRQHLFGHLYKAKGSPYSITERRVPELIPVFGSQPADDVSHKPGGRLPLLSPGLQLPSQPLRGLLPTLLLGKQRRNGCEQFA